MATHTITLELDDDLYRELAVAARDRGENLTKTALEALREYVRAYVHQVEAEQGFGQA